MRIRRQIICRAGVQIREVATATARDADFFRETRRMVDQHDPSAKLPSNRRAHHAGGPCADDCDIEGFHAAHCTCEPCLLCFAACLCAFPASFCARQSSGFIPHMLVLGIESSCDETGLALYDTERGLLAHALHSQIAMHREYGGVVPELASRDHIRRALPLLEEVLERAGTARTAIDAIAYTQGPGLAGALLVGASIANALAMAWNKPTIGIHHLEGHLLSPLLVDAPPPFPFVALLVSGGHTQLMRVTDVGIYETLGETLDDAAGEAFDKTAKLLVSATPAARKCRGWRSSARPARSYCHVRCCIRETSISASADSRPPC